MFSTISLSVSILALASVAAFFSIFGLAALAPTVPWSMIAMGCALELAQYTAVSYVYAEWKSLPSKLKAALTTVVLAVGTLTSVGVFGYLQSAFSTSLSQAELITQQLKATVETIGRLESELQQIDTETKRTPDNAVRARISLLREYEQRRAPLVQQLTEVRAQQQQLQAEALTLRSHTGPLSYVATAVGVSLDKAVLALALLLTVSLHPLALLLSMTLVYHRQKAAPNTVNERITSTQPDPPIVVAVPPSDPVIESSGTNDTEPMKEDSVQQSIATTEPSVSETLTARQPVQERRSALGTRLPQ